MHSRKERAAIREDVYRFIARYITVHVYPPSYKEIADALSISVSTAKKHINELIDEEILESDAEVREQRAFRIRDTRIVKRRKSDE
jgi:predicted ArsR family transcriptional regulator